MTGMDIAKLVFVPIAFFLALLLIGATVAGDYLTTYGSLANGFARMMLAFLLALLFIAYVALLTVGFGIAGLVRLVRRQ